MNSRAKALDSKSLDDVERTLNRLAAAGDRAGVANIVRELGGTEFRDGLVVESARDWLARTDPNSGTR